MPELQTRQFGPLSYTLEQIIQFPAGLPGFEDCHEFILHQEASMLPFLFLQSVADTNLSFVTLPVELIDENYELTLSRDDLAQLDIAALPTPEQIQCLAILQLSAHGATANLAAPIVITAAGIAPCRRGTQSIRQDRAYNTSHPVRRHTPPPEGGS